mgnify:CR=1 FL=1
MDFEFKPLTLDMAASAKADALVVLWPDSPPAAAVGSAGASLLEWVQKVSKTGDLEDGVGKLVSATLGSQCVAGRLVIVSLATEPIEGRASPRKPSVPTRNRSSASRSLLVAWLAIASGRSSG